MIPADEFNALVENLEEIEGNVSLVNTWYKIDTNAEPPVYILQPISSILGNFLKSRIKIFEENGTCATEVRVDQNRAVAKELFKIYV